MVNENKNTNYDYICIPCIQLLRGPMPLILCYCQDVFNVCNTNTGALINNLSSQGLIHSSTLFLSVSILVLLRLEQSELLHYIWLQVYLYFYLIISLEAGNLRLLQGFFGWFLQLLQTKQTKQILFYRLTLPPGYTEASSLMLWDSSVNHQLCATQFFSLIFGLIDVDKSESDQVTGVKSY